MSLTERITEHTFPHVTPLLETYVRHNVTSVA